MDKSGKIRRRTACAAMLGLGGGLVLPGTTLAKPPGRKSRVKTALNYKNADFYHSDGTFDPDVAKDVYLELLKLAGYPIPKDPKPRMYAKDWGLGEFVNIGLGGFVWVNSKQANYCALEMLLLPGQMIPEHWHVADEANGIGVKMESWHLRWGKTYTYGEGEPTGKMSITPPVSQKEYVTALCETPLAVGEVAGLSKPLEKHWQQAGPQGCIITEPSNYHSDACMRYTDPNIKV